MKRAQIVLAVIFAALFVRAAAEGANPPGEVYGYASWKDAKGIVILRNPSDKPQSLNKTSLAELLELQGLPKAKA